MEKNNTLFILVLFLLLLGGIYYSVKHQGLSVCLTGTRHHRTGCVVDNGQNSTPPVAAATR